MKVNKKQIGLILGLILVVILVILLLTRCSGNSNGNDVDETTTGSTETSETTSESTEPSAETTTAPTEETTEVTEETTEPAETKPGIITNNAVGSPGSIGSADDVTEATEPTEPEEEVILVPGDESNPYTEVLREFPGTVETVKIPAKGTMSYGVYYADGTTLTLESKDAYVVYNGKTYEPVNGIVTVQLDYVKPLAPAVFQVGNKAEKDAAYELTFTAPIGAPSNPEVLKAIEMTRVALAEYNDDGHTYNWTAGVDGTVTFSVSDVIFAVKENPEDGKTEDNKTDGAEEEIIHYEVILTAGGKSVKLSENGVEDEITKTKQVSIHVDKGEVLTIQVIALEDEKGNAFPKTSLTLNGKFVASPNQGGDDKEDETTKPTEPSDPSEPTAPTEPQEVNYSVSVKDYSGQAKTGVVVQFLKGSSPVAMQPVNASGVAAAKLQSGDYTVKLVFSGETLYYEEKDAVLSPGKNSITLKVAPAVSGTPEELYVGNAYKLDVGGTYVKLQSNATNYFIFAPTQAGVYKFTTSDPAAKIGYFGGNTFFIQDMTNSTDYKDNAFTRNVKEGNLGSTYILGVTGAEDCIIEITRISDPILDETDVVPVVYKAKTPPKQFTLSLGGKKLTEVDITAATEKYVPVYNESDGYYHLNSKTGPVLYVNLGPDAKYVSMYNMLGFTGFGGTSLMQYFYDDSGKLEKREDYTECMTAYVECIDGTYGVYPLTEDLKYMLQQGGDFKGWWDSGNENYLFGEVSGLNTEIAWMFAVCYLN